MSADLRADPTAPSDLRETLERVAEIRAEDHVGPMGTMFATRDLLTAIDQLAALIGRLAAHRGHEPNCALLAGPSKNVTTTACTCWLADARLVRELLSPETSR